MNDPEPTMSSMVRTGPEVSARQSEKDAPSPAFNKALSNDKNEDGQLIAPAVINKIGKHQNSEQNLVSSKLGGKIEDEQQLRKQAISDHDVVSPKEQQQQLADSSQQDNRAVSLKVDELLLNHLRDANIGSSDLNEVQVSPTIRNANQQYNTIITNEQADNSAAQRYPHEAEAQSAELPHVSRTDNTTVVLSSNDGTNKVRVSHNPSTNNDLSVSNPGEVLQQQNINKQKDARIATSNEGLLNDEEAADDTDEDNEAEKNVKKTAHFQEEQFLQEVENSKKMKDQFEQKFLRNHKPGVSQTEADQAEEGGHASADETDMPGFIDQAAQNNRVVPQNDDDDDDNEQENGSNEDNADRTEGTYVQRDENGSNLNLNFTQPESTQQSIQTAQVVQKYKQMQDSESARLRTSDYQIPQSSGEETTQRTALQQKQLVPTAVDFKNAYEVSAEDLKDQSNQNVFAKQSNQPETQNIVKRLEESQALDQNHDVNQDFENIKQQQLQYQQQDAGKNSFEIYQTKPPLKNIKLKQSSQQPQKLRKGSANQGAAQQNATNNSHKGREMAYAGIYGSSLVSQDKNILKSLGIPNSNVQSKQNLANSTNLSSKRRKASKNKKVKHHVERFVVQDEQAMIGQNRMNSSAAFGSGADASTKRGVFESDLGNSRDVQKILSTENDDRPKVKIEQQESQEYDIQLPKSHQINPATQVNSSQEQEQQQQQNLDSYQIQNLPENPQILNLDNYNGENNDDNSEVVEVEAEQQDKEDSSVPLQSTGVLTYVNGNSDQLDLRISNENVGENTYTGQEPAEYEKQSENEIDLNPVARRRKIKRKRTNQNLQCQYRELVLSNGVIFKGLSSKKDPLTGEGELHLTIGSVYKGQVFRGQPHGQGEMVWAPEGQQEPIMNIGNEITQLSNQENTERNDTFQKQYKGNWVHGKMEGIGKYTLSEGEFYYGYFMNNLPYGHGIRKFANGDLYDGEYVDGYQTGVGMFICQEQGWKYEGQWLQGRMTGEGICQWRDGTMYKGTWKNCAKDGHGVLTYADGSSVECGFINEYPEGRGVKTFPDGSIYKGSFRLGLFHGQGRYRQPLDGSEYNGNWVRNEMKGQGVKKLKFGSIEVSGTFSNGQEVNGKGLKKWRKVIKHGTRGKAYEYFIYRGQLENSQIEGFGELKWPDGRHYIGDFVNSQMHGHGKMTWTESTNTQTGKQIKNTYKGDMFANVIHGRGVLKRSNGDYYEGEFENALFNGEGIYLWANNKLKYKGQLRNGHLHGFGVLHNYNGIYEGEFRKGLFSGKGLMTFYNGDKYSGEFSNSQMTGYGCYSLTDGTKMIGHFEDGICNRHAKKLYPDGKIYIGEFKDDVENGKGLLIDGNKRTKGIWRDAVLIDELVKHDVSYENSVALTQYSVLSGGFEQTNKDAAMPEVSSKVKPGRKIQSEAAIQVKSALSDKFEIIKKNPDQDDEEDERNAGLIFDEQQFEMDGREYFEIEYLSGDIYRGELQGDKRHGFGMFTYKLTGEKVLGIWKSHFMMKDSERHPYESLGELIPLAVSKYEGRAKKASSD